MVKRRAQPKRTRSRPKPSPTSLLAPRPKLEVPIDRALKKRWTEALTKLTRARDQGAGAFDELWETAAEIIEHDPPLYLAGGFATATAFITKELAETERTARRYMRVALFASPKEEARYGISKLDAALAWLEAKAGKPRGRIPVDFTRLRIPLDAGETIPFEEASVQQIAAATRRQLARSRKPRGKRPPIVRALVTALGKRLGAISVSLTRGKLAIGNIAPTDLPALAKALTRVRPPAT
jgi:hypothetical protein